MEEGAQSLLDQWKADDGDRKIKSKLRLEDAVKLLVNLRDALLANQVYKAVQGISPLKAQDFGKDISMNVPHVDSLTDQLSSLTSELKKLEDENFRLLAEEEVLTLAQS